VIRFCGEKINMSIIREFKKESAVLPGFRFREFRRDIVFIAVTGLLTVLILLVPTGFEGSAAPSISMRAKVRIADVNNEKLKIIGPVRQGEQQLEVEILSGPYKGQVHSSSNNLMGKMEVDKVFVKGDIALAVLNLGEDGSVAYAQVIDHYRTGKTIFLAAVFIVMMFVIMGWMGLKIVISFIFSATALIRVLYPMILRGWDPIFGSLIIITVITALIMFLVGGLSRRALAVFLGAVGGVVFTSILAFLFTIWFKIHGAVRPFTETLLFSGFGHLNLAHLFISGVFIAASGAIMDLAMDVAAAMDEIKKTTTGHSPHGAYAFRLYRGPPVRRHYVHYPAFSLFRRIYRHDHDVYRPGRSFGKRDQHDLGFFGGSTHPGRLLRSDTSTLIKLKVML
jgi:uncharacterized membrane protein